MPPAGGAGRIAAGALPLARLEHLAGPLETRLAGRGATRARGTAARVRRVPPLPPLPLLSLLLLPPATAREVTRHCAAGGRRDGIGVRDTRERRTRSSYKDTCARALQLHTDTDSNRVFLSDFTAFNVLINSIHWRPPIANY